MRGCQSTTITPLDAALKVFSEVEAHQCLCEWHAPKGKKLGPGGSCRAEISQSPMMFVAGFPCAPFSAQRSNRSTERWYHHKEIGTMQDCLRYVRTVKPLSGVFENVMTMQSASEGEKSGLSVLLQELKGAGYCTLVKEICLSHFHDAVRKRCLAPQCRNE